MTVSFDRAADYYDQTRGYTGDTAFRIRDAILQKLKATHQTRFLELGVGTGRIAFPFIQAGYNYTGVDISEAMLAKLQEKINADAQATNYKLHVGDITKLPFEDNSFDVAISVHVFHLVSEWQKAIGEAQRVLIKPGGVLLIGYDDADGNAQDPVSIARKKWEAIIGELGAGSYLIRPGEWKGEQIIQYLVTLGAQIEQDTLAALEVPTQTFRKGVERIASRMYSSQWQVPDDIFTASVLRLRRWLETEIANPDEEIPVYANFKATFARF